MFNYIAIPSTDFERAFSFYQTITDEKLRRNTDVPFPMAYFIDNKSKNIGHLFKLEGFEPSSGGPLVYLELFEDINVTMKKIEGAGGKVVMGKTLISPTSGYWGIFLDTEGNKLALHSNH
jgi:predicted enzyme related to lactoylglutathione lyase